MNGFEEFVGVAEVDDVDVSVGTTNDEKLISDIHGVNSILTIQCRNRIVGSEVPVFDLLIPGSSNEVRVAIDRRKLGRSDRLLVCG